MDQVCDKLFVHSVSPFIVSLVIVCHGQGAWVRGRLGLWWSGGGGGVGVGWGGRRGDGDCGVGGGCFVWVIGLYGWLGV